VNVHVEIERRAEPLDDRHSATAPVRCAGAMRAATEPGENGADEDRHHRTAERVIEREHVPQPRRQTQHPLPHRHAWKDVIHQVRGPVRHAAAATARTEAAPFAREGHQSVFAAGGAAKPRKAGRETAARQEIAELALDKPWQALPVAHCFRFSAKCLEVLAHDLMQGALLGPVRLINGGGTRHLAPEGKARAHEGVDYLR